MNIELFGCAGGMAEGFRRAGVRFDLSVDKDPDAVASYAANIGHKPVQADVHNFRRGIVSRRDLRASDDAMPGFTAGWYARHTKYQLLVADPPCTPWSDGGNRLGLADPRDCMDVTVDIILALRPETYLIGNVPGLGNTSNLAVQRYLFEKLRKAGYCTADFVRLNAADYGVPQMRRRPFWFGHLAGPCIRWPAPSHCDPAKLATLPIPGVPALAPWVTCRHALGHLPADELGEPVTLRWRGKNGKKPDHRPSGLDEPAKTQTTNTHSARQAGGEILVWPWPRPSTTVTTKGTIGGAGRNKRNGRKQNGIGAVKLSEKARAILQGFPPGWRFLGSTKKSRSGQIGMAMPPPLAEAVAWAIREQHEATR